MMRSWIYITRGRFARQARVGTRSSGKNMSRHGFAGPVAMLYRTDGPNEVVRFSEGLRRGRSTAPMSSRPMRQNRAAGRLTLLSNEDVAIAIEPAPAGDAVLLSQYRRRPVVFRSSRRGRSPPSLVARLRARRLRAAAKGNHLPADAGGCRQPAPGGREHRTIRLCEHEQAWRHLGRSDRTSGAGRRRVRLAETERMGKRIKHEEAHTSIFYRNNRINVVGWKGDLFPFKLNVRGTSARSCPTASIWHLLPGSRSRRRVWLF